MKTFSLGWISQLEVRGRDFKKIIEEHGEFYFVCKEAVRIFKEILEGGCMCATCQKVPPGYQGKRTINGGHSRERYLTLNLDPCEEIVYLIPFVSPYSTDSNLSWN